MMSLLARQLGQWTYTLWVVGLIPDFGCLASRLMTKPAL